MTDAIPARRSRHRPVLLALTGVALATALAATGWLLADRRADQALADRRAEVTAKGRTVMPFDLDRTTHTFRDLPDGGLQTVTANDPTDRHQTGLIQAHLRQEAAAFTRGDFADPAAVHGRDMPGLAELRAGAGRVTVSYRPLPDGAELRYGTTDPTLVAGIHSWFQAQSMDHGGHDGHH